MKNKKPPKPRWYWAYWGISYALLLALFGKKIGSGLFSLFLLVKGFALQGMTIISDANQGLLDSQTFNGWFSFSMQEAVSLAYLLLVIAVTYSFSIFVVAQFILPVSRFEDRTKAAGSFASYISGAKGVAIFVKEGGKIESHGESDDASGGVILADLSSAVALSSQKDVKAWDIAEGAEEEPEESTGWWRKWAEDRKKKKRKKSDNKKEDLFVHPVGPGLTFIKKGQKITSEIDLRPQTRRENVKAYMRNGIQVSADVSVTFSLSAEPEIIYFGRVSDAEGVNLRWLDIDENRPDGGTVIRGYYELDDHDIPILRAYTEGKQGGFADPEISSSAPNTPFKFYKERVFHAAFSNARSVSTGQPIHWHEAPLDAAKELLRRELLTVPYDDLYSGFGMGRREGSEASNQTTDALKRLDETFKRKMKLKGEILFQYIENPERSPFHKGEIYGAGEIIKYSPIRLTHHNFNSLRSVGVVIKSASISNLQPSSDDVKKRLIANWRARWEKEVEFINAQHELESVRIQNRNRAQIQQEMTHLLSSIFQSSHTDEALALRVFQALELAAANPGSENDITAREVVDMLDSLHRWLLVDRKDLYPGQDNEDNQNQTPPPQKGGR